MADSIAFSVAAETLENLTELDRLESRGTIRIALKQAGFDARSIPASQLCAVVEKVLPAELDSRGVQDFATVCRAIADALSRTAEEPETANAPESVFARLGGEG